MMLVFITGLGLCLKTDRILYPDPKFLTHPHYIHTINALQKNVPLLTRIYRSTTKCNS